MLLLALLCLAACRTADLRSSPASAGSHAFATRLDGVTNLARIHPNLYRGAQPDAAGFALLKELGIKTVISLREDHSESGEVEAAGMGLVQIPLQANLFGSEPPSDAQVAQFFRTVLDPAKQPVYFHCALGADRTGTFAALWRIEMDGWTNAEAIEEMQAFGYHDYFVDLIDFVRHYKRRGFADVARDAH